MAEYALIDGYLAALRTSVRWRRDVEDLVAEVEDHLYSTVERFEARGTDTDLAQRKTLDRFGDPDLLAAAFASTPRGGIALPTKFTVTAGTAAVAGAALWVVAAAILWIWGAVISDWDGVFLVFLVAGIGAGVMTMLTTAALRERHGGLGVLGLVGLVVFGAGMATSVVVGWAIPLWVTIEGVGALIVALSVLPLGVAPRWPTVGYGAGLLIGAITFAVVRYMEVGPVDQYGDYTLPYQIGFSVGAAITAAGLLGLGRWLRNEEPAPAIAPPDQAATT